MDMSNSSLSITLINLVFSGVLLEALWRLMLLLNKLYLNVMENKGKFTTKLPDA